MEFSLLLLGLALILSASENLMETMKEEFAEEKVQPKTAKRGQEKETAEALMNLALFDKNVSLSFSKSVMPSSLLTFRLCCSLPKRHSPVNEEESCSNTMACRKVSEANGSCEWSTNFIHGPAEESHRVSKTSSYKCGQNPGVRGCESPELENTVYQLTPDKQLPRCQNRSVTSLEKMLTLLAGHSLMGWLVSGSKL